MSIRRAPTHAAKYSHSSTYSLDFPEDLLSHLSAFPTPPAALPSPRPPSSSSSPIASPRWAPSSPTESRGRNAQGTYMLPEAKPPPNIPLPPLPTTPSLPLQIGPQSSSLLPPRRPLAPLGSLRPRPSFETLSHLCIKEEDEPGSEEPSPKYSSTPKYPSSPTFDDLLSTPLPKRRPSFQSSQREFLSLKSSIAEKGDTDPLDTAFEELTTQAQSEPHGLDGRESEDSEIDIDASLEAVAWRTGVMSATAGNTVPTPGAGKLRLKVQNRKFGWKFAENSDSEEDDFSQHNRPISPDTQITALDSKRDSTESVSSGGTAASGSKKFKSPWQAPRRIKSYKLQRRNQNDEAHDSDLSSEEESFDLAFDSHSHSSSSTNLTMSSASSAQATFSLRSREYGLPIKNLGLKTPKIDTVALLEELDVKTPVLDAVKRRNEIPGPHWRVNRASTSPTFPTVSSLQETRGSRAMSTPPSSTYGSSNSEITSKSLSVSSISLRKTPSSSSLRSLPGFNITGRTRSRSPIPLLQHNLSKHAGDMSDEELLAGPNSLLPTPPMSPRYQMGSPPTRLLPIRLSSLNQSGQSRLPKRPSCPVLRQGETALDGMRGDAAPQSTIPRHMTPDSPSLRRSSSMNFSGQGRLSSLPYLSSGNAVKGRPLLTSRMSTVGDAL